MTFGTRCREGARASVRDYLLWLDERERHRAAYRDFFREWDVLLSPMNRPVVVLEGRHRRHERTVSVDGVPISYLSLSLYPSLASVTGQPATVFPIGQDRAGLPIGIQAIGPYLEDRTPLRFAALLAASFGGFQPPTGLR